MNQRLFTIIGHNPNTLVEVRNFLAEGANAIEPDVHFDSNIPHGEKGRFYISHGKVDIQSERFSLEVYLQQLRWVVADFPNQLALIAFDTKTDVFPVAEFVAIVEREFLFQTEGSGVSIIVSRGPLSDAFLADYPKNGGDKSAVCVGIDESADLGGIVRSAQNHRLDHLSIGYGITEVVIGRTRLPMDGIRPETYNVIANAVGIRAIPSKGKSVCSYVYSWVIMGEVEMKRYLDLRVDGMIVDLDQVALLKLVISNFYSSVYRLAIAGDLLFQQSTPSYRLFVKTSSNRWFWLDRAGTDATISFELSGQNGKALRTTIDASQASMMEEGGYNYVVLEGEDIGVPVSLKISLGAQGSGPDWTVDRISILANTSTWHRVMELGRKTFSRGTSTELRID